MANTKPKNSGQKSPAKTLHIISTIVMGVSAALLLLELFNVFKTYVGGFLLGVGFLIEGISRLKTEKGGAHNPQNKPAVVLGIAVFIIIAGLVYMYLDLM